MSQNIPLCAFKVRFCSRHAFGISLHPTGEAPYLLKQRFSTIEHLVNKRSSGNSVIGHRVRELRP